MRHGFIFAWLFVIFVVGLGCALAQDDGPEPFPTATPIESFPTTTATPQATPTLPADFPTSTQDGTEPAATFTPLPTPTLRPEYPTAPNAAIVETACYVEPKWSYLMDVRRGPSHNWGVIRQYRHTDRPIEFWVFGRDEESKWYHILLPEPINKVGWVSDEAINLFGACDDLPIDDDTEITPEEVPAYPARVPLPEFAVGHVQLTRHDRAFLLKPGILYIRRDIFSLEKRDRIQAHMMMMDLNAPQLEVQVAIGAPPDQKGVPLSQIAEPAGAFVAVNGDFYAGNYWPQGITVIDGEIVIAPKLRAAFGVSHEREPFIGYFTSGWTWPATVTAENGEVIPLQLMNLPCETGWLCLYSDHRGERLPASYRGLRVLLDNDFTVVDMVENQGLDIPEGHYVLRGEDNPAQWLRQNVEIGDTLTLTLTTDPPWQNYDQIISGGPRILVDGEFWQDCDPETENALCEEFTFEFRDSHYGLKSLPRAAVGYNSDSNLIYVVVAEGYEVDDSGGMTQREMADFFAEFGADHAMEFDGGGSSTLYVAPEGVISDYGYEGERPVPNALLFFWNEE